MARKIRQLEGAGPNTLLRQPASPGHVPGHASRRPHDRAETANAGKSADKRRAVKPKQAHVGRNAVAVNKSAFVRSLPVTLSAAEVIQEGKSKGIKLTAAQVYTIRANARRKSAFGPALSNGAETGSVRGHSRTAKEADFVSTALDLGLARAEALLRALRAKASTGWS